MHAGHDYIGVGVGALVFNEADEVFLSQRGPKAKNERGCWEFPGGSVEFGETLQDAIQREVMEEHGLTIEITGLLGVVDHILPDEGQHWVSTTFLARHVSGDPRIIEPEKCTALGWFRMDALPAPLSEASIQDVATYHARFSEG